MVGGLGECVFWISKWELLLNCMSCVFFVCKVLL